MCLAFVLVCLFLNDSIRVKLSTINLILNFFNLVYTKLNAPTHQNAVLLSFPLSSIRLFRCHLWV